MTGMLCAVCADRPATHPDLIDGRRFMVCLSCRGDEVLPAAPGRPKDPRLLLEDVVAVVERAPGASSYEVAVWLGLAETDRQRQRVYAALSRLSKMRQIEPTTGRRCIPQRYRVVEGAGPLLRLRPEQAPASRLADGIPPLVPPPPLRSGPRQGAYGLSGRVLEVLRRSPGIESSGVADYLGMTSVPERNHVSSALCRLVRAGLATFAGASRAERLYYPAASAVEVAA
jgi:hypothetical protein